MSEIKRKLATIRKIDEIKNHPNADLLEIAKVDGWQTVVKKGEFSVGEDILFIEVDAFLPIDKRFEFLRDSCYRSTPGFGGGFRVRSKKLRKILSQGLVFKLSEFPEIEKTGGVEKDIDSILGVRKYEAPIPTQLSGLVKGVFPSFIPKTDEERLQNIYKDLSRTLSSLNMDKVPEKYKEKTIERVKELNEINNVKEETFEVTVKLDGTSMTLFYNNGEFGVCSRNLQLNLDDKNSSFVKEALKYKDTLPTTYNYALQGELCGPGIQKNRLKLNEIKFYVFSMWDIDKQEYVSPEKRRKFCETFGLNHVPVVNTNIKAFYELKSLDEFLAYAERKSINDTDAEGIVFKSNNGKVHFKVLSNYYLLKNSE